MIPFDEEDDSNDDSMELSFEDSKNNPPPENDELDDAKPSNHSDQDFYLDVLDDPTVPDFSKMFDQDPFQLLEETFGDCAILLPKEPLVKEGGDLNYSNKKRKRDEDLNTSIKKMKTGGKGDEEENRESRMDVIEVVDDGTQPFDKSEFWIFPLQDTAPISSQIRNINDSPQKTDTLGIKTLKIWFVDVGQGNCTLVECPGGEKLLIDCGSVSKGGRKILLPHVQTFFKNHVPKKLDYLLVSHADKDHVNFLPDLLQGVEIENVLCGGTDKHYTQVKPAKNFRNFIEKKHKFSDCLVKKGEFHSEDPDKKPKLVKLTGGVEVRIVSVNAPGEENESSLVVAVRYAGKQVLICADATESTETTVLSSSTKWTVEKLKSYALAGGHHGSEGSFCAKWLQAVDPSWVFFGADILNNNFLHPRKSVIERVLSCCPKIKSTSDYGPHGIVIGMSQLEKPQPLKEGLGPCETVLKKLTEFKKELAKSSEKSNSFRIWRFALLEYLCVTYSALSYVFTLDEVQRKDWIQQGFRLLSLVEEEELKQVSEICQKLKGDVPSDALPPDVLKAFGDDTSKLSKEAEDLLYWLCYWALRMQMIENEKTRVSKLEFKPFPQKKPKKKAGIPDKNYFDWRLTDFNLYTSLDSGDQGVYWLLEINSDGTCVTNLA